VPVVDDLMVIEHLPSDAVIQDCEDNVPKEVVKEIIIRDLVSDVEAVRVDVEMSLAIIEDGKDERESSELVGGLTFIVAVEHVVPLADADTV